MHMMIITLQLVQIGVISYTSCCSNSPTFGFRPIVCLKTGTQLVKTVEGVYEMKEES